MTRGKVIFSEARLTSRQPIGLIGGVHIPVVLLVILGELPVFHQAAEDFGGLDPFDVYMPILIAFSLTMLALLGLSVPLASYRELGVLRRLSTTPFRHHRRSPRRASCRSSRRSPCPPSSPPSAPPPAEPRRIRPSVSAVHRRARADPADTRRAVARTANAANVVGRIAFFPMMLFAGLWLPRALMPPVLRDVSNYTPLGAVVPVGVDQSDNGRHAASGARRERRASCCVKSSA